MFKSELAPLEFKIIYKHADRSFITSPRIRFSGYALSLDDIELPLDDDKTIICAYGYCPRESWEETALVHPRAKRGRIFVDVDTDLVPGCTYPLNAGRMSRFHDPETNWFCLGDRASYDLGTGIEFGTNSILVLQQQQVIGLWLKIDEYQA